MTGSSTIKIFDDKESLAHELAVDLIQGLSSTISEGRLACIALSGGSTPTLLFRELAEMKPDIDWNKVRIFWVDERCVPPDHPESNFRVARETLLDPLGIPESSWFRMRGEDIPEEEAARYARLIEDTLPLEKGIPVFDRIFLGMGSDGHTASIFPHQSELWDEQALCTVGTHPDSGQQRVTLSGKVINAARRVTFMITGAEKYDVLRQVMNSDGDFAKYPASRVNPGNGVLEWYLDKDAAGTN